MQQLRLCKVSAFTLSLIPQGTSHPTLSHRYFQRTGKLVSVARRSQPRILISTMSSVETKPIMYGKAAKDGKSVGDCPFTHKARLALEVQGVDYDLRLIDLTNKPSWYLDINKDGTVPALVIGNKTITSSDDIITYADEKGKKGVKLSDYVTGNDEAGQVSRAFVSFIKEKQINERESKAEGMLTRALSAVNAVLENSGGPFMSGKQFGAVDCRLAPTLYAVKVAGKHYKGYVIPEKFAALHQYMDDVSGMDAWKRTAYPEDVVISGWAKFF